MNKRVRACASMGTGADAAQTWHACAEYRPRAGRLMRTVTRHTQTGCVCWCTLLWQKLWLGRWQKGLDGGRSFPTSGNDCRGCGPGVRGYSHAGPHQSGGGSGDGCGAGEREHADISSRLALEWCLWRVELRAANKKKNTKQIVLCFSHIH